MSDFLINSQMAPKIETKMGDLNLGDEVEEEEVGGPTSDKGKKVIDQLDDLDNDDLDAVIARCKKIQRDRSRPERPKCMCGSLLIGRFKEEGTCNKCQEAQKQMEKVAVAAGAKKK